MSGWRLLFRQLRAIGKSLVSDDIKNLGEFREDKYPEWLLGLIFWYGAEILTLVDFFFPFNSSRVEKPKPRATWRR